MITINPSELRRGNYILLCLPNDLPRWHKVMPKDIYDISEGKITLVMLEPIPLTPKILLSFEFNLAEGDRIWEDCKLSEFEKVYWIPGMYFIEIEGDKFNFYFCTDQDTYVLIKQVKYLHELQNICFILTNEELTYQPL